MNNKRALSAKIRMRAKGAVSVAGTANNEHETDLYNNVVNTGEFIDGNLGSRQLAICHKMSSFEVQTAVANAANTGNWAVVQNMIKAVRGGGWTDPLRKAYEDIFDDTVDAHAKGASDIVDYLINGGQATAQNLTDLAGYIANSPANLFIGKQRINASIQSDGDFNSTEITPTVTNTTNGNLRKRRLTLDSQEIAKYLPQLPNGMQYVSHQTGLNSSHSTARYTWASNLNGTAIADTYLTSSTDRQIGYAFI